MPAKDDQHDVVVRCLLKADWTILKEQEYLSIGASAETHRRLYIDIKAQSSAGVVVLIEVKALDRSPMHQLMALLGQYLVYRAALDYLLTIFRSMLLCHKRIIGRCSSTFWDRKS